jgi:hypothetical protein
MWKYGGYNSRKSCLSSMTVKKVDGIPALIKVCFGTICANAAETAASSISEVCGVKRGNMMWIEDQILIAVR